MKDASVIIFRYAWVVGELEREPEYSQNGNGNESQERERVMRMSPSASVMWKNGYRLLNMRARLLEEVAFLEHTQVQVDGFGS